MSLKPPTPAPVATPPQGYYTEGKIVNGTNVGGGVFVPTGSNTSSPSKSSSQGGINPLDQVYPNGQGGTNYIPNPQSSTPVTWDSLQQQGVLPGSPKSVDTSQPSPSTTVVAPPSKSVPISNASLPSNAASPQPSLGGNVATPAQAEDMVNKYASMQQMGAPPKTSLDTNPRGHIEAAGSAIDSQSSNGQAYQPTPAFMQYGDPIMQSFVSAALSYQNDVTQTGYAARNLQAVLANQVQGVDLQAANLQNIMNGTRDDIRAEINKAGGFATESQVEGLVTTRNRDLLKQYNNLELQKQTMQNQMQLQVSLANADHQYAQDKFDNLTKTATLYKGIYDNATNQVDKLIQNVGYSGLAAAYNNDPHTLAMVEQHLSMPQGTLSNPQSLQSLETYRQRTLNLSSARFNALYGYSPSDTSGGGTGGSTPTPTFPGGGAHVTPNPSVPYERYGLLTNTDFNPSNGTDKNALNYLDNYLKTGVLPTKAGDIGITVKGVGAGNQFTSAKSRAETLYFNATGQNMPLPEVIKNNIGIINANNKLENNLKVQEGTIKQNFGMDLKNLTTNNMNSGWTVVNNVLNDISSATQDPNVAQYFTQNATIQQELANLMAVKNAAGTTVYDKATNAGILPKGASPEVQVRIIGTLLKEAQNAYNVIGNVNADLYKQVDPLERQTGNPNRQNFINAQVPSDWVTMTGPKGTFKVDPKNVDVMKKNGYK